MKDPMNFERTIRLFLGDEAYGIAALANNPKEKKFAKVFQRLSVLLLILRIALQIRFGSGAHHCPCERAAESEILLILVTILPSVRLYQVDEMPPLIDATVMRSEKDFRVRFELL